MRTRVAIIGAGPAGLLLSHLLGLAGIDSVLVERQSAEHVQARIRAGILESSTVELLTEAGLGERLARESLDHQGIYLQWPGNRHHLDFLALAGRSVCVYGQTELTKDLMAAVAAAGRTVVYEAEDVTPHDVAGDHPYVTFTDAEGTAQRLDAEVIAGCDGFHGPSRDAIPGAVRRSWSAPTRSHGWASWPTWHRPPTTSSTRGTRTGSPCTACARTT